jgi:hypothetical protein
MGMGKPDVCRTTELALPIPAFRSIRKNDKGTPSLNYRVQAMRLQDCGKRKGKKKKYCHKL